MNTAYTTFSAPVNAGFTLPSLSGEPPAADRQRSQFISAWLSRDVPGQSTANSFSQIDNYIGAPYIAIQAIMKAMSGATVKVMERKQKRVITKSLGGDEGESDEWQPAAPDHAACRLLDFPNPVQTLSGLLSDYVLMLKLTGRAFLWAVPGKLTKKPKKLWVLGTPYVTSGYQVTEQYPCGSWQLNLPQPMMYGYTSAGITWLDAREVCELRLTNPRYYWAGYSPLQAGSLQIDALTGISQARKSMMDRGSTIDGMVSISGATFDQLTQYKRELDEKYAGQARGGRILVTGGDDIKAVGLTGLAPKDMGFQEGYEQLTKFVTSLMGTPGQITGMVDAQSYASFYAQQLQFQTMELQPLCKMIAEYLTLQLIRPHWGPDYKLVIEPPRIDDVERADRQYDQDKGILTVNERRRMRNHKELGPDGDVPEQIYIGALQAKQQAEQQAQMQAQQMQGMEGQPAPDGADPAQVGATSAPSGADEPQGGPDEVMSGALLSALGMDSPDASGAVQKSLRRYYKALEVIRVPTKSGKVAAKYSGSDRVYYGAQAQAMLDRAARNAEADFKTTEEGQEPDAKDPRKTAEHQLTGGVGAPAEAKPAEAPKQKFTLKFQSKNGPGSLDFDNEQDARDAAIAFGFPGHELHGPNGKIAEGKGGKWADGSDDGKGSPAHAVANAVKTVPPAALPIARRVAPKVASTVNPAAKQLSQNPEQAKAIKPAGFANAFADKFHKQIGAALGLSPEDAHEFARNLADGFARGVLMKLTKQYIPMSQGRRKSEEDIRAEERGKMIQYEDDTPVAKPVKPGKIGASGRPLATLKNGPPRPASPLGVRKSLWVPGDDDGEGDELASYFETMLAELK